MIDDSNRLFRSLVCLALICLGRRVSNLNLIGPRDLLAGAGNFSPESNDDVGDRQQHG